MQTFVRDSQSLVFCKAPCKMAPESRLGVKRTNQVSMPNTLITSSVEFQKSTEKQDVGICKGPEFPHPTQSWQTSKGEKVTLHSLTHSFQSLCSRLQSFKSTPQGTGRKEAEILKPSPEKQHATGSSHKVSLFTTIKSSVLSTLNARRICSQRNSDLKYLPTLLFRATGYFLARCRKSMNR